MGVAPMVLINVLDPAKHKADISEKTMQVNDGVAVLDEVGVLLEGLTIKADATPLEAGKDYTTTWNNDGTLNIVLLKGGAGEKATTLTATGSKIDPSKVKAADIVGGVDISSGKETGLEVVRQVYPLSLIHISRGRISAPGYFSDPAIRKAYTACSWNGPARTNLNPVQEVTAAIKRVEACFSTAQEETAQMTGGDYNRNIKQRVMEAKRKREVDVIGSPDEPFKPVEGE